MLFFWLKNSFQAFLKHDCLEKRWTTKKTLQSMQNPSWISHHIVPYSEFRHGLIAVPEYFSNTVGPLDKLVGDTWKQMSISFRFSFEAMYDNGYHMNTCHICQVFVRSYDMIFLHVSFYPLNHKYLFAINTNVLSLQNLAAKTLFDNCANLSEETIIESTDLPYILKRHYFGPKWAWASKD